MPTESNRDIFLEASTPTLYKVRQEINACGNFLVIEDKSKAFALIPISDNYPKDGARAGVVAEVFAASLALFGATKAFLIAVEDIPQKGLSKQLKQAKLRAKAALAQAEGRGL